MSGFPFFVTYWNCASGLSRKWHFLQSYVSECMPDILFIAEAEISDKFNYDFLKVDGYRLEFANTITSRGKCRLICLCRPFFERVKEVELEFNELIVLRHKFNIITGLYRPFKCFDGETQGSNFDRLLKNLELVTEQFGRRFSKVVVGDFNVHADHYNCRMKMAIDQWGEQSDLLQLVDFDTRSRLVGGVVQHSMIDHVYSNIDTLEVSGEFNAHSDHVILNIKDKAARSKSAPKKIISFLDWRRYTPDKMRDEFASNFVGFNIRITSPDEINDLITGAIVQSLNKLVPKRVTTVHGNNPVINPVIQNLKNKKTRIYKKWCKNKKPEDWLTLKDISRRLNSEIRRERSRSLKNSLNRSSKDFWTTVNGLMGRKIQHNIELEVDGVEVTDDKILAEAFACFFESKIVKLNNSCNYTPPEINIPVTNEFIAYSHLDVRLGLNHLKRSKAQGFDEVPGSVLKDLGESLVKPLCWLFNSISEFKNIPKSWKISKVVPVFKKGSHKLVENYRPVSNVSSICKVFERCLLNKLLESGSSELFGSHQHGFFPGRSTNTASLTIQDYICRNLDDNKIVLLYSADLSAAFDMLRSESLVDTLIKCNINPNLVELIYNFLQGRTNFVQINEAYSTMKSVPLGCVQGSVIGPSLFNIFTQSFGSLLPDKFFKISYADDSYVAIACDETDLDRSLSELSDAANVHFEWLDSIGMCCNRSKTEFVIFDKHSRFRGKELRIGNDIVKSVTSIKILGTIFQENLKWTKHISRNIASANSMLQSLRYINRYVSRQQFKMATNAHFVSKLMFGSTVWNKSISSKERLRLSVCLNRVARMNCGIYKKKVSNRFLYESSGMRSLTSLCTIADCTMLHKLSTVLDVEPLCERLMSQCYISNRFPNKVSFFDYSQTRIGKGSFVHRAKRIAELLTFDWINLSSAAFKSKIRERTAIFMK